MSTLFYTKSIPGPDRETHVTIIIKVLCSRYACAYLRTSWAWGLPRRSACARALSYDGARAQGLTNTFELPPALRMQGRGGGGMQLAINGM